MKIIIAGSRSVIHPLVLEEAIMLSTFQGKITEVISGMAKGVDKLGVEWAKVQGITLTPFPADWYNLNPTNGPLRIKYDKYGVQYNALAGLNRNTEMAKYADGLIAIWDGYSTGTYDMIKKMRKLDKPSYTYTFLKDSVQGG